MRAVIYARVSTSGQAEEGFSIPAQLDACRKFIASNGWELAGEYVDPGETGRTFDRPLFQEMLLDIKVDGSIKFVVGHKLDRFGRNLEEFVLVRRSLADAGVRLVTVVENVSDTVSGKLVENIMASVADWGSRNLSEETKKGKVAKAREGWYPSVAPIGYMNKDGVIAIDPDRAPLVQAAFELYASGNYGLQQLKRELTVQGLRSKDGHELSISRVQALLKSEFYIGCFTYAGVKYDGKHEPLIDRETFKRVQDVLFSKRDGARNSKHPHYLRGLIYCSCGRRMSTTDPKGGRFRYFFCLGRTACDKSYVPVKEVDRIVEELYQQVKLSEETIKQVELHIEQTLSTSEDSKVRRRRQLIRRLDKLKASRKKLLWAFYDEKIPADLFAEEQDRLADEVAKLESLLAAETDEATAEYVEIMRLAMELASDCRSAYVNAPDDLRAKYNEVFLERVVLSGRVLEDVKWRDPFLFLNSEQVRLRAVGGGGRESNPPNEGRSSRRF